MSNDVTLTWLLTGGFAKGYRTYILAALGALTAASAWAVGDQSGPETARAIWEIVVSLSVGAARAALPK